MMNTEDFKQKLEKAVQFARISRIARLTRMDYVGLPVYQCTRPFSRNLVTSQGKAFTEEGAKISAIMESLEAFHGESIPVDEVALYRDIAPHLTYDFKKILSPIPNIKIKWTKAFDLIQKKETYIPQALISLNFSESYIPDFPIKASSNGFAGGSSLESAQQHAILEILERHIMASTPPNYIPLNAEIHALLQPYFEKLHERHFKMGIFNYAHPLGLPMFKVNIQEPGKQQTHCGMACHPDKNTALIKAFCEALQSRVTSISGARDDIEACHYLPSENVERLEIKIKAYESIASLSHFADLNPKEKIHFLINKIEAAGFENLLMVDLTKKEIEIPIVVAIVPGFQMHLPGHRGFK